MKRLLLIQLGVGLILSLTPAWAKAPNILLIYSDDHGWADLAIQGVDPDIRTPNLDQLARDGVRFSRGYVSAPQCVPSRAGVITGTHQNRFGVEDNRLGPLPLDVLTLPERLKGAGYITGMCGKWHLDLAGEKKRGQKSEPLITHMPQAHGFDEYWRGEMRQYYASHDLAGNPLPKAPVLVQDPRFRVVVQTEAALSFLNRRAQKPEQPWFLYLAWYAPHVPLESPEPWFSQTPTYLPKERRQALAMIAAMDDGLGQLRAKLKAMGVEKDTLIFFIGDNGAPTKKGAWNGSLNRPLIGEKGMLTDGGVRVPFLVCWPQTLPGGKVYAQPVVNLDVAATAVALAGLPHDAALDGVDLMPYLTQEKSGAPHEALFWRWRSQAAVLEFPWKLIQLGAEKPFLFDVTQPDGETRDLAALHPEMVARLQQRLQTWSLGLKPAGAAEAFNAQDLLFYQDHIGALVKHVQEPNAAVKSADDLPGSIQGWLCRNGTLKLGEEGLTWTPASTQAKPFLTHSKLAVPGPVELRLKVKAGKGGSGQVSWRTQKDPDFTREQVKSFVWPSSEEWAEITLALPVTAQDRLIHLRLTPPAEGKEMALQQVEIRARDTMKARWDFGP
ncbi:uncharacterized sulfatase [Prosthecobacter debontii]|uniref:Uncharacterized sulfatase n=1 Tax=Prosthecobacter debontii TaxID=48467 RepID=A0A1T4XUW2_9BACT|nr:sulfatase-like hydrolase/transferase [Prosthecobacter debontii]SKA93346.1 uncharacterized sulfatase [Prosthecobacter debontii]